MRARPPLSVLTCTIASHIPTEFSLHVFDMLVEAGKDVGLVFAGLQALETLRPAKASLRPMYDPKGTRIRS
jgi:glycine cleavage system aminomethyltransferase T